MNISYLRRERDKFLKELAKECNAQSGGSQEYQPDSEIVKGAENPVKDSNQHTIIKISQVIEQA